MKAVFLHSVLMKETNGLPCEIFNVENVGIKCLISLYRDGVYFFFSIFREEEKLILYLNLFPLSIKYIILIQKCLLYVLQ